MSPYYSEGSYTTEDREVAVSETWDSWANPQSSSNVEVVDGSLQLAEAPDTPDSVVARYDATELSLSDGESVDTWPDISGNGHDLTANGAPTYQTDRFNGNPAVYYDGSDDSHENTDFSISQPNAIVAVWKTFDANPSDNDYLVNTTTDTRQLFGVRSDSTDYGIWASNWVMSGVAPTTDFRLMSGIYDGGSSEVRLEQSSVATGDGGTQGLDGLLVADGSNTGQDFTEADLGELLILSDPSDVPDAEDYLAGKWGPFS